MIALVLAAALILVGLWLLSPLASSPTPGRLRVLAGLVSVLAGAACALLSTLL